MLTPAISYLTTSNLPWFIDLTFQVPVQYCSLEHQISLPSRVTPTTGCCFLFGSASSLLLELFLCSSPVAYCAPTTLGSSSLYVISFCLFILFMGFSRQEYWSGLSFPSLVDHVLSELSTMTHHSWVALQSMAHSFTDLHKPLRMHRWFSGHEFKQTLGDRGGQRSLACCSPWDHTEWDMT